MSDFYKFIFTFLLLFSAFNQSFSDEVNVYTSRHYDSDNAIYEDFTNLTGINVTITPTVASSKILVHFCLGKVSHASNSTGVRFTRSVAGGSAAAIKIGDADGNRQRVSSNIMGQGMINAAHAMEFIYQFVDTPTYSVGQAIVYQMQVNNEGSGNFYVNRSGDDSNDTYIYRGRAFSTMTAMEVSA